MRHSAMRNSRYCFALESVILIKILWRHQMETVSAWQALCAGNSPVTGEFPSQRPVTLSCDAFFDLHLNKQLSKQSRRRWLETLSRSLWHHCNDFSMITIPWQLYGACRQHHMWRFACVIYIPLDYTHVQHIEAQTKYPPFRRRYFQMRFREWDC